MLCPFDSFCVDGRINIMTRKDFQKIAKILKTTDLAAHQRASLAVSFASVCKEDNSRFDVQRFLTACGVETPKAEVTVL